MNFIFCKGSRWSKKFNEFAAVFFLMSKKGSSITKQYSTISKRTHANWALFDAHRMLGKGVFDKILKEEDSDVMFMDALAGIQSVKSEELMREISQVRWKEIKYQFDGGVPFFKFHGTGGKEVKKKNARHILCNETLAAKLFKIAIPDQVKRLCL